MVGDLWAVAGAVVAAHEDAAGRLAAPDDFLGDVKAFSARYLTRMGVSEDIVETVVDRRIRTPTSRSQSRPIAATPRAMCSISA
jgi:hypothetical protein